MKLVRYGEDGLETPAVLVDGRIIDASGEFGDYDEGFFACDGLTSLQLWVGDGCPGGRVVEDGVRMGAPIARPSKIVCVGKNYADHAKEFDSEIPNEPVLFMKASSAFSGPLDDVEMPLDSTHLDYEAELSMVIGRTTKNVTTESALEYIAGYSVMGDYTERDHQKYRGGQWTKGKSADTFAPMGPCLTTCDEISNISELRIWTKVNGELRQNGWTGDMLFDVPFLVSYISKYMTLLPGDVISTGTPAGVGMGMIPPTFLQLGDKVDMGIDEIGVISQHIVTEK